MTSEPPANDWRFERLPSLAGRVRTAVLLNPREADELPPATSKFGGRILWPSAEPWPVSEEFDDCYVPVLQLNAADFPELVLPVGKDLLQLLWCPHYSSRTGLAPRVHFRRAEEVAAPLQRMPRSRHREEHMPSECLLRPERVQELPPFEELELDEVDHLDESECDAYKRSQSIASCSKLGGYPAWIEEPQVPNCDCGATSAHYLTVASTRRLGDTRCSEEGTGLMVLDHGALYVFACRKHEPWQFFFVLQGA